MQMPCFGGGLDLATTTDEDWQNKVDDANEAVKYYGRSYFLLVTCLRICTRRALAALLGGRSLKITVGWGGSSSDRLTIFARAVNNKQDQGHQDVHANAWSNLAAW